MSSPQTLIAIRRHFLSNGIVPGGVPLCIVRSWQRSANHGLDLGAPPSTEPASREWLRDALERNEALVQAAWGEIETLCRDTEVPGGIVVLTDPEGVILMRVGGSSFTEEADRMALRPGVNWGEPSVGTNAIGIALFERRELSVVGAEHFLETHSVLSCSAVPIVGPDGSTAGVLDLSTPSNIPHGYTLALVRRAAEQIERRLFEHRFGCQEQMHLHSNPYLLGSPHDGLLAFDGGRLIGATRNAVALLGLAWSAVGSVRFDQLFSVQHASIQRNASSDECVVQTSRGSTLFARMQPPRTMHDAVTHRRTEPVQNSPSSSIGPATGESVPHDILARLQRNASAGCTVRKMNPGLLIYGGEEIDKNGECILLVRSGRLRCFSSFEGKELTLFTLAAGDALILHPQTMLEVKKDSEIIILRQSTFRQLARDDPELGLSVIPVIERTLQKSIRIIEEMAFHGVKYRLVRALCDAADRDGRQTRQGVVIDIAPNGEEFAMQVAATRQSVSTVIAGLIRAGLIQRLGSSSIIISNMDRLKAELETPP